MREEKQCEDTQKFRCSGNAGGAVQHCFAIRECECEIKQYIGMREMLQSYSNYTPLLTPFALLVHTGAISFRCCRLRLFFSKAAQKGAAVESAKRAVAYLNGIPQVGSERALKPSCDNSSPEIQPRSPILRRS